MVDFYIARLKQTVEVDWLYGVGAFPLLLAVKPPFLELGASGRLSKVFLKTLSGF